MFNSPLLLVIPFNLGRCEITSNLVLYSPCTTLERPLRRETIRNSLFTAPWAPFEVGGHLQSPVLPSFIDSQSVRRSAISCCTLLVFSLIAPWGLGPSPISYCTPRVLFVSAVRGVKPSVVGNSMVSGHPLRFEAIRVCDGTRLVLILRPLLHYSCVLPRLSLSPLGDTQLAIVPNLSTFLVVRSSVFTYCTLLLLPLNALRGL